MISLSMLIFGMVLKVYGFFAKDDTYSIIGSIWIVGAILLSNLSGGVQ